MRPEAFDGVDFVFFAATGALAKELAPEVVKRGGIAIDKSNTWRMDPQVPLVHPRDQRGRAREAPGHHRQPELHHHARSSWRSRALRKLAKLKSAVITTFQSVTGAGLPGLEELDAQLKAIAAGRARAARPSSSRARS